MTANAMKLHPTLQRLQERLKFDRRTRPAEAAVLVALTREAVPRIVLTRRSLQLKQHAGEVSFPGGKREPGDTSNIVVALRESHEEIGLDPFAVHLLGSLPAQRARSGIWVRPIVGLIDPDTPLQAQPDEIDRIFWVSLQQLQAVVVCVDLYAAAREERGYAGDPGVAAIGLRIGELRGHRELMTTLGRSLGLEGPDGAPSVVDGASPGLARARSRVRELRVQLTKVAQRMLKQPGIAEALQDSFYTEREGRIVLPVRADAFSRRGAVAGVDWLAGLRG